MYSLTQPGSIQTVLHLEIRLHSPNKRLDQLVFRLP
jgi:hypothetical protein